MSIYDRGYEDGAREANRSLGSFVFWCIVLFIVLPWLVGGIYDLGYERGQKSVQAVEKTSRMEIRAR
jgi:hypothetical protein